MQHIITILPKADGIPTSTKQEIAYVEIAILADSNTKYSAMLLAEFAALLKVKFLFTTKLKTVEINNDVTLDNWILQLIASLKKKEIRQSQSQPRQCRRTDIDSPCSSMDEAPFLLCMITLPYTSGNF